MNSLADICGARGRMGNRQTAKLKIATELLQKWVKMTIFQQNVGCARMTIFLRAQLHNMF